MTSVSATTLTLLTLLHELFLNFESNLSPTSWRYPESASISNGSNFDFIIIGGGTAGSVLASRLSENGNYSVLLIEAGPVPPIESLWPGLFPVLPLSKYDWNYTSENDGRTAQLLQDQCVSMTAGKMLGGSGSLEHTIHVRGQEGDFAIWEMATNDSSWNLTNMLPYFKKMESVKNEAIMKLYGSYHGSEGPIKLTVQHNEANTRIINAFVEMGSEKMLDANANQTCGIGEPLLSIAENERQGPANAYLTAARNRTNYRNLLNTLVKRIIFNSNNVATSVQAIDSNGDEITINANKEIIVSAGAVGSPHLLMLSGIGPKDNLEKYNISVIADLPVGQKMTDHLGTIIGITMDKANISISPSNYGLFPVPVSCGYESIGNCSKRPDYQSINLLFPPASSSMLQLCIQGFKYNATVCDALYAASNETNLLFSVFNHLHPVSTGNISLTSGNYTVPPRIYHGMLSNDTDLIDMATYLKDFSKVLNSTYFKEIGAQIIDFTDCSDSYTKSTDSYWRCYALKTSASMWHYSGTCAMGRVSDNELKVKNVLGLRVVDASAMPGLTSGNIKAAVLAIAEKASELILAAAAS